MKVTYNWLKDFVEIRISPQALAEKLTMAGLEVTSLEKKDGDFVLELEVTSNRPDCLSIIGIAREVAAITGKRLKLPHATRHAPHAKSVQPNSIKIENKKDCPLYTAKIIKDVKVGASADWLKKRLELIGCRSVNNVVDITNYILFTYGEPLHAFDLDKLNGNTICVRRAKTGEKIITIDGEQKMLNPDILVIADAEMPVAVAGVMGSKDTEVTELTKNVLLEAAAFNPIIVRHGRQNLGIQSESSYRFERGVNLEVVENASWQAVELIEDATGGRCVLGKSSGLTQEKKRADLELSTVNKTLGINITQPKIKKILNSLGFKTKTRAKNHFVVEIPLHRDDVKLGIDLIEEIARIYGYAHIPTTLPAVKPQVSAHQPRDLVSLIKSILMGLGLSEAITYSLMDKDLLRNFGGPEAIEILNPLSKEQEILRPRLMPSLAACVAYNLNQKQDYINIFEVAKVFLGSTANLKEELRLGFALCGIKSLLLPQGSIKDAFGLLHLKGILEVLFARLGISDYSFNTTDNPAEITIYVSKENIGLMTNLAKPVLDNLDIKNKDVFAAEISLDRLFAYAQLQRKFRHPPVYPGISRDISLLLKEGIAVGDILEAIRDKGRPWLREVRVVDYYKGKQIPAGFKGLTISCLYRADERTLTEAEINPAHSLVCALLAGRFGAQIR